MTPIKILIISAIILILLIPKKVSAEKLISKFEGLRLRAYKDTGGVYTIGYGSTKNPFTGISVKENDLITRATAVAWLQKDISQRQLAISKLVRVPINSNKLAAITSLAYNIGLTAFQTSTLLRLLNNQEAEIKVADQFLRWNKVNGVVVLGLTNRRKDERELFLS